MKKSNIVYLFTFFTLFAFTDLVFAGDAVQTLRSGFTSVSDLVNLFTETVVKSVATLFLSLALLAFFYGIVEYIWGKRQGDSGKAKAGNEFMTWGLVALFVMFSVYGIIKLFQSILFQNGDVQSIIIPEIRINRGGSQDVRVGDAFNNGNNIQNGSNQVGGANIQNGSTQTGGYGIPANSGSIYESNCNKSGGSLDYKGNCIMLDDGGGSGVSNGIPANQGSVSQPDSSATNNTSSGPCTQEGASCVTSGGGFGLCKLISEDYSDGYYCQ